jgi:hypothetical protein
LSDLSELFVIEFRPFVSHHTLFGFQRLIDFLRNSMVGPAASPIAKNGTNAYLARMSFEFCIPTKATAVPDGPDWLHEIKYDGYRLRLERDGDRVRLITRGGYNWADRYPWIVEAALKNRFKQFVIDGEAVVLGVDGVSDFNALHSRKHDHEVQLYPRDAKSNEALRDVAWHAVRAFDAAGPLISRSRGSCVRMGFYERQ